MMGAEKSFHLCTTWSSCLICIRIHCDFIHRALVLLNLCIGVIVMSSEISENGKTSVPGVRRKPVPMLWLLVPKNTRQEIKNYQSKSPVLPICCNGRRTGRVQNPSGH